MHAEEFVLIPKRMFISKNPTKEEIFDNPMYQQKATQLALLQRTNPNFERNNEKKVQDADTSFLSVRKPVYKKIIYHFSSL